ncbi:MAG: hypothetical protein C0434_11625 [Xanthomonadaceae bacterium]|nr:hypothetical protein [Xanthomonadaceae bacterium]
MAAPLSSLPAERWAEFSRLLDQLLEVDAPARAAWLAALGPEHADLFELLRQAAAIDGQQQEAPPPAQPRLTPLEDDPWTFAAGRPVGPYRLIAPLGQGGMGEVWSAQRIDGTLNREVALKLPHTWLLTAGARLRLGRERDFLAGLSHPNIAQLFDAGIADDGQPWMALEKVDGQRIDAWCRSRRLPIADRLRLFLQVTDAVSAAHARLIVHRDIKPSNVLVTDEGRVKLLDFGIAKLIDDDGRGDLTEITRLAGRSATPEYAAPEQLSGATITAATDVYALGVVLYELLCGRRPRPARRQGSRRDDDESPLLASSFAPADFPAQAGGLDVAGWRRALEGDLDAILTQALAAPPEARYSSVERMADDLRRHLASEPVSARHITRVERALKFARRNRLALGSAIVVSLSLLAGGGISLWQAQRATAEARRAAAEAARANATRDFLLKVFSSSSRVNASDKQPGSITAREMLDEIVDGLDGNLARQPEVQLELLVAARSLYRQWYLPDRASAAHARYRAVVTGMAGPLDIRIVDSLIQEAGTLYESDRDAQGVARMREARTLIERGGFIGTVTEANWLTEWIRLTEPIHGIRPEKIDGYRRAAGLFAANGDDSPFARWNAAYLGDALLRDNRPAEALAIASALRARQLDGSQANDWQRAIALQIIGSAQRRLGDTADAETALAGAGQLMLATFGRSFESYWQNLSERVDLMASTGRDAQANALIDSERQLLEALPGGGVAEGNGQISPEVVDEALALLTALQVRLLIGQGSCGAREQALKDGIPRMAKINIRMPMLAPDARMLAAECALQRGDPAEALQQIEMARAAYAAFDGYSEDALLVRERWAELHWLHGPSGMAEKAEAELRAVLAAAGDRATPVIALARMTLAEMAARRGDAAAAREQARLAMAAQAPLRVWCRPALNAGLDRRFARLQAGLQGAP